MTVPTELPLLTIREYGQVTVTHPCEVFLFRANDDYESRPLEWVERDGYELDPLVKMRLRADAEVEGGRYFRGLRRTFIPKGFEDTLSPTAIVTGRAANANDCVASAATGEPKDKDCRELYGERRTDVLQFGGHRNVVGGLTSIDADANALDKHYVIVLRMHTVCFFSAFFFVFFIALSLQHAKH